MNKENSLMTIDIKKVKLLKEYYKLEKGLRVDYEAKVKTLTENNSKLIDEIKKKVF